MNKPFVIKFRKYCACLGNKWSNSEKGDKEWG